MAGSSSSRRNGGGAQSPESSSPAAANLRTRSPPSLVTSVLNNDDLLCEILLRPASPVGLVRATLVCKLWLSIISNPAFLRRFRKLYRPLLGFYLKRWTVPSVKFMSMPCIQELDSMIVRAGSAFDGSDMCQILYNSRNGRLLGSFHGRNGMLSPLNLEGNIVLVPPLWITGLKSDMSWHPIGYFLNDQDCLGVSLVLSQEGTTVHLYELLDGVWKKHTSSTIEGRPVSLSIFKILLTNYRLYIISSTNKILVLDLISLVLWAIERPDGVELKQHNLGLSQADDTGFNLVHLKGLELRVWLYTHRTNNNNNNSMGDNWLLVHNICLPEVCANLRIPTWAPNYGKTTILKLHAVGDNAEFVFLEICGIVIYLDIMSRVAEKVYKLTPSDGDIFRIHPFTMIWPPTFPCPQSSQREPQSMPTKRGVRPTRRSRFPRAAREKPPL